MRYDVIEIDNDTLDEGVVLSGLTKTDALRAAEVYGQQSSAFGVSYRVRRCKDAN
jgi:hypothetical protein